MYHDLMLTTDKQGRVIFVFHPNDDRAAAAVGTVVGATIEDRRAGHVWPKRYLLRMAFRALRAVFGSKGRVAMWTRHWRCGWIVVDARNGERLPGVYASHTDAVAAEVRWSLAGVL